MQGGGTLYDCARAREEQAGAVAERAHQVQGDYDRHARAMDHTIGGPHATDVLDHLRSFGAVRALVFGQYGECSPDVHDLLSACADAMAARTWRRAGMRTQAEARAHYITIFRRELCIVVTREFARHRLRRRCFIGVPRAAVRAHMQDRDDERRRRQHADVAWPGEHRLHDLHRHQAMGPPVVAVRA